MRAFLLALLGTFGGYYAYSVYRRQQDALNDAAQFGFASQVFDPVTDSYTAMLTKAATWTPPAAAAPYMGMFNYATDKYGLPANLLARQAQAESNYDPTAKSGAGAVGLMQIVPSAHPEIANPLDPAQAIDGAAAFLSRLYDQFGTWEKALAGYNWGPGNLSKAIASFGDAWASHLPAETYNYVKSISKDVNFNDA